MPLTVLLHQLQGSLQGHEECLGILSATLDAHPVASFLVDSSHRVIHWNRACGILTGVPPGEVLGTSRQGQIFYGSERMVMADLIVRGASEQQVDALYHGKLKPSTIIPGTFEAEDFFPQFGQQGRWLYFSAAPIHDTSGKLIGAIETLQDVTERRQATEALKVSEERFKLLSRTDSLTKLFNFRHFQEQLDSEVLRAARYGNPLSLMLIDVDHFKQVNDSHGHLEGDRVLRLVAEELSAWMRRTDLGFRYGGDEFAVLLPATDHFEAQSAAFRLVEHWSRLPKDSLEAGTLGCTLSIGLTQYISNEPRLEFISRADMAVYEAKRLGRNRVVVDGGTTA